ncbi:MAG TPA: hypothetical protein VK146_05285 [Tabrizicola sp.]|nr:hypothetical protein [Tabrizicola sp.]
MSPRTARKETADASAPQPGQDQTTALGKPTGLDTLVLALTRAVERGTSPQVRQEHRG